MKKTTTSIQPSVECDMSEFQAFSLKIKDSLEYKEYEVWSDMNNHGNVSNEAQFEFTVGGHQSN